MGFRLSAAALIGRLGLSLVALDDRRVQIDGRDLLVWTPPPHLLQHLLIDLRQSSQWRALLGDITHLPHRQFLLRILQFRLVVKLI